IVSAPLSSAPSSLAPRGHRVSAPRAARKGEAWWAVTDSNRRHSACKADALPTELTARERDLSPGRAPAQGWHAVPDCHTACESHARSERRRVNPGSSVTWDAAADVPHKG